MNRILFFLILINLNACSAQKNINNNNNNNIVMYIKDYNSKFEKLDTSVLTQLSSMSQQNKEALPKQLTLTFKKRDLIIQRTGSDLYHLRKYNTDDDSVQLEVEVNFNGGIYYRERIDDLFYYSEIYYLNGNIHSKGIASWLGFSINKGYKYDKEGNLTETIDYDEGYEFNYEKVLQFCRDNNIDILWRKGPSNNTVNKITTENRRKVWNIDYFNLKTGKIDFYQLDGHTGEIIQKELGKEIYGIKHY